MADEIDIEKLRSIRTEAGRHICPDTAEIMWCHADIMDPYGDEPLSPELAAIGRVYFARAPGSDQWVSFYDIPVDTRDALEKRKWSAGR